MWETAISGEVFLGCRTSSSERLRAIIELSTYRLNVKLRQFNFPFCSWKEIYKLIKLLFLLSRMQERHPEAIASRGFCLNMSRSETWVIQTIGEKHEDGQMAVERLWRQDLKVLDGNKWLSWAPLVIIYIYILPLFYLQSLYWTIHIVPGLPK